MYAKYMSKPKPVMIMHVILIASSCTMMEESKAVLSFHAEPSRKIDRPNDPEEACPLAACCTLHVAWLL
jgi:hypothetical protein